MKQARGWKKITEDTIELVKAIDRSMNKKDASLSSRNKAIGAVTGIQTTTTIANIRESNYNFATYKELIRSKYSSAYVKKLSVVKLNDIRRSWNDIIAVLDREDCKVAHFLQESNLPFYNGTILVIEVGHTFHLKTLEKDVEKIESAIEEVLGKNIRVSFKVAANYSPTPNIKPEETNHGQGALNINPAETNHKLGDLSAFRQVDLTFASEEETYVFHYLNKQGISSVERLTILNNLITAYLILVKEDYEQEGVKS